ncbi:MAG: hypothetical protein WEA09_04890 [Gemmatimonadota bacterium]
MISARRGYLTMAVRKRQYLEMAVDMALSLREWSRLPIALATDEALRTRAEALPPGVFHEITLVEPRFLRGRAMKYGAALASPFQEAIFIDSDCLVLSPPDPIFQMAGPGPLTFIAEVLNPEDDRNHQGFSTRHLMQRLQLSRYFKSHSGAFHLRRAGAIPLMEACLECYINEILPLRSLFRPWRFLGDELGFGVVGGRRGFDAFQGPSPIFWGKEILELNPEAPLRPILHFIGPVPSLTLEHLLEGVRRRRREVGLPEEASVAIWRAEAGHPGPWTLRPER